MRLKANANQKYTSKKTSIKYSDGRLPRTYSIDIPPGSTVLDYGCGQCYDYLEEAAKERGWDWFGYDPYNGEDDIDVEPRDYVICSNVLNVVMEDEIVKEIVNNCMELSKIAAYFSIYDKNRDGNGEESGNDKWQRNEGINVYSDLIDAMGYKVNIKNKIIKAERI